jgi:Ca2+-binding RTX toxin-like protein
VANPIPTTFPIPQSGDLIVDAMTHGYGWILGADRTVDWAIANGFDGEYWVNPSSVQQYVALALSTFSYYADVKFNYVGAFQTPHVAANAGSEITFSLSESLELFPSNLTWAIGLLPDADGYPGSYAGAPGDVFLNIRSEANSLPSYEPGSAGWFLLIHELGHVLGLKHPHDDGGTGRPTLAELGLAAFDIDWATMMAYGDDYGWSRTAYDPATPMLLDVLALQVLYGPNRSTNAGDNTFELIADGLYKTIWDASGNDLVSALASDRGWAIQLPEYQLASSIDTLAGFALPLGEVDLSSPMSLTWLTGYVENASGSAFADVLYGSSSNNMLTGSGGNDWLEGGAGNDLLNAGVGSDTAFGDEGDDTLTASGSDYTYLWAGDGNDSISGGAGFDNTHGNQGNDTSHGHSGDDWVVGGKGLDQMFGDAGDDLAYGNIGNDTLYGGDDADRLLGGQDSDTLSGGAGNDFLSGDRGTDTISGGSGADTFYGFDGTGVDRITDFNYAEGDRLQLFQTALQSATVVGSDTVVSFGTGDQLILVGITTALPADFVLSA